MHFPTSWKTPLCLFFPLHGSLVKQLSFLLLTLNLLFAHARGLPKRPYWWLTPKDLLLSSIETVICSGKKTHHTRHIGEAIKRIIHAWTTCYLCKKTVRTHPWTSHCARPAHALLGRFIEPHARRSIRLQRPRLSRSKVDDPCPRLQNGCVQ